ncbi:MAG: alpha/beta fold hydrolase [Acidimicrobiales bacterium]
MPLATINDHAIYYEDTGGDGTAVVFSHGFLMDRSMFDPQIAALSERFRCVSWDERGFGQTECKGPFTYWDSASDLLGLLDQLSIERAVLVGMSQGGFVSLRAALTSPERVSGVVLIDSQAGIDPPEVNDGYQQLHDTWVAHGAIEDVAGVIAGLIFGPSIDHHEWLVRWRSRPPTALTHPFNALVGRDDITHRLGEIECPVLIFHGSEDQAIPMEQAESVRDGVRNCVGLVVVDGASHSANLTHPDAVNGPLADFIAGI